MTSNTRNINGVKDSSACYLDGGRWTQWTDETGSTRETALAALSAEQIANPSMEFKAKKIGGSYRIYRRA